MTKAKEEQYNNLLREHLQLKEQYKTLNGNFEKLKEETSENTIIQSMNDMKIEYERVMKDSVPLYRFTNVKERYDSLYQTCQAAVVLLERIRKKISTIHRFEMDETTARKAEMETIVVKDLIKDAITK